MRSKISPSESTEAYEDVFTLLSEDHDKVSELFEDYQSALEAGSNEQQDLAEEIYQELERHAELEEDVFYPALAQQAALNMLVEEAIKEHGEVKEKIQQLRSLNAKDPDFGTLMLQLMDDVEHHVSEEESVMYAEVERNMDAEVLADLAVRLQERKRELAERA